MGTEKKLPQSINTGMVIFIIWLFIATFASIYLMNYNLSEEEATITKHALTELTTTNSYKTYIFLVKLICYADAVILLSIAIALCFIRKRIIIYMAIIALWIIRLSIFVVEWLAEIYTLPVMENIMQMKGISFNTNIALNELRQGAWSDFFNGIGFTIFWTLYLLFSKKVKKSYPAKSKNIQKAENIQDEEIQLRQTIQSACKEVFLSGQQLAAEWSDDAELDDVLEMLKHWIKTSEIRIAASISQGMPAEEIAAQGVFDACADLLISGRYHVYRGVLSMRGKLLYSVFHKSYDYCIEKGYGYAEELLRDKAVIEKEIKEVG